MIEMHSDSYTEWRMERNCTFDFADFPLEEKVHRFVLGGVFQHHLETVAGDDTVKKQLKENIYVDNIMGLVANEDQAIQFKEDAIKIMEKKQFPLAKWESNIQALNDDGEKSDTKLLGINCNKTRDTYRVSQEKLPTFKFE